MFENIRADLLRFSSKGNSFARLLTRSFGFQAVLVYRFGHWLHTCLKRPAQWVFVPLFPVYWLLALIVRNAYGIHLASSANIGPGFFIWHFGEISIRHCTLGSNCTIHHRVTIEPTPPDSNGPSIGNYVWIGPHVQIRGAITLGDRVTLGAGAVVTESVASGNLLLGNPARVIRSNYDNSEIL